MLDVHPNIITITTQTSQNKTPLMIACEEGLIDIIHILLSSTDQSITNTLLDASDNLGNNCLMYASWRGNIHIVRALIETYHMSSTLKNYEGLTCIQMAAAGNHTELVKYLLTITDQTHHNSDPDPDAVVETDVSLTGMSLLHRAVQSGSIDTVKLLLLQPSPPLINTTFTSNIHTSNINSITENGMTALHIACKHGYYDITKYLIEYGHAILNIKNDYDLTPLHFACIGGYNDIVRYLLTALLDLTPDLNRDLTSNLSGDVSYLQLASQYGHHDTCQLLIDRCFDSPSDNILAKNYKGEYYTIYIGYIIRVIHSVLGHTYTHTRYIL